MHYIIAPAACASGSESRTEEAGSVVCTSCGSVLYQQLLAGSAVRPAVVTFYRLCPAPNTRRFLSRADRGGSGFLRDRRRRQRCTARPGHGGTRSWLQRRSSPERQAPLRRALPGADGTGGLPPAAAAPRRRGDGAAARACDFGQIRAPHPLLPYASPLSPPPSLALPTPLSPPPCWQGPGRWFDLALGGAAYAVVRLNRLPVMLTQARPSRGAACRTAHLGERCP